MYCFTDNPLPYNKVARDCKHMNIALHTVNACYLTKFTVDKEIRFIILSYKRKKYSCTTSQMVIIFSDNKIKTHIEKQTPHKSSTGSFIK
jgi:hypothetical protein